MLNERSAKVSIDCCRVLLAKDIGHRLVSGGGQSVRDCHSLPPRLSRHCMRRSCDATRSNCQHHSGSLTSSVPTREQTLCHDAAPFISISSPDPTRLHRHLRQSAHRGNRTRVTLSISIDALFICLQVCSLPAFIIGVYSAISRRIISSNCAGVMSSGDRPIISKFARTVDAFSILAVISLSLRTSGGGVLDETKRPTQNKYSALRTPASCNVGTLGRRSVRSLEPTASALSLPVS